MEDKKDTDNKEGGKSTVKVESKSIKRSNNKSVITVLFYFSLLANAILIWLYWQQKNRTDIVVTEKQTVIIERENIQSDLIQLQSEFSNLQTSDKKIQAELDEKKEQIAQLLIEAEKHKNDAYFISKLKKESETLRKIMQGYVRTIDSLGTLNKTLLTENVKVRTQYLSEQEKSSQLIREKDDLQGVINAGSILRATGTTATGVSIRSGGKRESTTSRARKVDKIKVELTISANSIAKKGTRDVFLRIITPDGKELARALDDANSFSFKGSRGFFCARQSIDYTNNEIPLVLYAENKAGYLPGKYIVEVYCEQSAIGQTTLELD